MEAKDLLTMEKMYMIAECVGQSIYEQHTIAYVYPKREWAEHQLKILESSNENEGWYRIREVFIVRNPPK
jgi:hypothetical protein